MDKHLSDLISRFPQLENTVTSIQQVYELLRDTFKGGNKVLVCGNGGSAADAEHWSGELLKGFEAERPLDAKILASFPDDTGKYLQDALPIIPLTGFPSMSTAFANDKEPEAVFAQLTWALGRQDDVLVAISTSGNANNVLKAVYTARARGMKVAALSGMDGGKLKDAADICILCPGKKTRLVQEMHLPVYHAISLMLEDEFFGN